MKRTIFLFFMSILCSYTISQIRNILPSGSSLASTSVSDSYHWTPFSNPANIGYVHTTALDLQYENRYGIPALSQKSVGWAVPSRLINGAASFSHFGFDAYHELILGAGFARNFSDHFALGLQLNYYTVYSAVNRAYSAVILPQMGMSLRFSERMQAAFQVFNPAQQNISGKYLTMRIPSVYSVGTRYSFADEVQWRTQVDREVSSLYRLATAFDYQLIQSLCLKLGMYFCHYAVPCMGFDLDLGRFLLGFNADLHPVLGLNTLIHICYSFIHSH